MSTEVLSKIEDWDQFNSSLLIEVTRPDGVFTCTGVAVSDQTLVTAAHCLDGIVTKIRVFVQGHYDPKLPSLDVKDWKIHPTYNPKISSYHSDIAKITMKEKLPRFIRLYPIFEGNTVRGELYRFGFGAREKQNLRTVITPTLKQLNQKDSMVELNDKFSRSGDSGGPIFMKDGDQTWLLAIHSTLSHGPEGSYSYNPMLKPYLPWIYSN